MAVVDGPFLCFRWPRPVLGLPSASASACLAGELDAADLGELEPRLPDRDGTVTRFGFDPVHEVEHVALDPAAEAMEGPLGQVHRAAGLVVVVERAADFQLIAVPDRLEAVVGEDGAEVRPLAKILEVNASVVGHDATATVSYSQQ